MKYLTLARWPHWAAGLFALMGIFYARKLFNLNFVTISFWFFFPFFLAGIASELMISALSVKRDFRLLSDTERRLASLFGWRVMLGMSVVLFVVAVIAANIFTRGMNSSWYVLSMAGLAIAYGLILRRLWMIDLLAFPLFYLIPVVAGTLDTMLPLFAAQIAWVYLFGAMIYAIRLTAMLENSTVAHNDHRFVMVGGQYDRAQMTYLLGCSGAIFSMSVAYHLLEQAATIGRMSLIIIPLMMYMTADVVQRYRGYMNGDGAEKSFHDVVWNKRMKICIAIGIGCLIIAVNWRV